MTDAGPDVTVLIVTHQFERFIARAIDSALAQRVPGNGIEVVVVDDGSTDATESIARGYGDRIRYLRHPNAGSARSVERGLLAARGEVIVLLDGDDVLHPGLAARQLRHLRARPEVGLCCVDRRVVDADDRVMIASFEHEARLTPLTGRPLGTLAARNFVTFSGTALRAALVPAVLPIPADAPAEDWWLAVNVVLHAELDHIGEQLVDYRLHGGNRNLGNSAQRNMPLFRRDLRFRRRLLRTLWCSPLLEPGDLVEAQAGLARWVELLDQHTPGAAREALHVDDDARCLRDGFLARAGAADSPDERVRLATAALGEDPFDATALALLQAAARELAGAPVRDVEQARRALAAALGAEVRERITVARVEDVLAEPDLLTDYAEATGAGDAATLVLWAPDRPDLLDRLPQLVATLGLDGDDAPDMLGTAGSHAAIGPLLAEMAVAVIGRPISDPVSVPT